MVKYTEIIFGPSLYANFQLNLNFANEILKFLHLTLKYYKMKKQLQFYRPTAITHTSLNEICRDFWEIFAKNAVFGGVLNRLVLHGFANLQKCSSTKCLNVTFFQLRTKQPALLYTTTRTSNNITDFSISTKAHVTPNFRLNNHPLTAQTFGIASYIQRLPKLKRSKYYRTMLPLAVNHIRQI